MNAELTSTGWKIRGRTLPVGRRTLVMGIVNVTPDSFSDGGRFLEIDAALRHARDLESEGADILDIGGESTRPGSESVPERVEIDRVVPVIEALKKRTNLPISVDTRKAGVAEAAFASGAEVVNDVTALADPRMPEVVREAGAGLVLMHMLGDPKTMQKAPAYKDVTAEVAAFLRAHAEAAERAGIPREAVVLDPGLGFGKRTGRGMEDNLVLLRDLGRIAHLGYPVLVGASRKTFIGNTLKLPVEERLEGSLAAAAIAVWNGAQIVRVHDVKATRRVVDVVDAIRATRAVERREPS